MMLNYNDLTIIEIALGLVQQNYKKDTHEWRRIKSLLDKIKKEQCGNDRRLH